MSLQQDNIQQKYGNSDISISYIDQVTNEFKILDSVDVWVNEQHNLQSMTTKYPIEDGSSVSDNIYVNPANLELEGFVSNLSNGSISKQKIFDAWEEITKIQKEIIPVRVTTNLELYGVVNDRDMYITNIQTSPIDASTGNSISFRMTLHELKIVESEEVEASAVPQKKVTGDNNPAKNSTSKAKSGKKRSTSLGVDIFEKLEQVA